MPSLRVPKMLVVNWRRKNYQHSQKGETTAHNPEQAFIEMFLEEWQAERGQHPLASIAIVDENPQSQYLLPEFILFKKLFEQNNINAVICDPLNLFIETSHFGTEISV